MSGSLTNQTIIAPYAGAYFVGFNSANATTNPNTTLYDIALINADLLIAFKTRPGERVMRPDFGCTIWNYFMEPFTPTLRETIVKEAIRVCHTDSRVVVQNVQVFQQTNGLRVEITLLYQPWNVINSFYVNFEASEQAYFSSNGVNSSSGLLSSS